MPLLEELLPTLPTLWRHHAPSGPVHALLRRVARGEVEARFGRQDAAPHPFGPYGMLSFPYFQMGAVDSLDLFGLDELIIFSFYWANRNRYRRVVDFGANIGLHSIVMARCGWDVRSFEPDPEHFSRLVKNLERNGVDRVELHNTAVSVRDGEHEFVRVLGNTTGSHLAGEKSPYGELERFDVRLEHFGAHLAWADLAKIDIEGHEREILVSSEPEVWKTTDAIVEVGNPENAAAIFDRFRSTGVNLFAQKDGWLRVEDLSGMPVSHRDGSLFVSRKSAMPWTELEDED